MSPASPGETNQSIAMGDLIALTQKLSEQHLSTEEASQAAHALASADVPDADKELFLIALAEMGETADEVVGFTQAFLSLARDPGLGKWAPKAIDVCGTGGDKIGSFNISTAVTFVLAAGGVPVLKHGNRSITSKCGSADLLAALGVPWEAEEAVLQKALEELSFTFLFAPAFHPAFKAIMPVRQELARQGQRTIFNILGPLINPGRPAFQLLGVFSEPWMSTLAETLDSVGLGNGFVVHCRLDDGRGMDELSCAGENRMHGFGESKGLSRQFTAADVGLEPSRIEDLTGGDLEQNLAIFNRVINNQAPVGLTNSILLNAGVGFEIAGKADDIREGIGMARELLQSGDVRKLVEKTAAFYRG